MVLKISPQYLRDFIARKNASFLQISCKKVRKICKTVWKKAETFKLENSVWLSEELKFELKKPVMEAVSAAVGRPKVEALWKELGLRVDMPKIGGFGSTNDGNTARRAFTNCEVFSEITGVDQNLIMRLKTILICLSSKFKVDSDKFQAFCFATAELLQKMYPWLPLTPTVHKELIHSKEIINNSTHALGFLGETASESRHKIYKANRLHHARRNNRVNNLLDIFNRASDTSDPLISTIYLKRRVQQ